MKRELLVLLAAVTLTVAMVPRLRREVPEATDKDTSSAAPDTSSEICMLTTPCAWTVYKPKTKIVETFIDNTYCKCPTDLSCLSSEEDIPNDILIYHCKPPKS